MLPMLIDEIPIEIKEFVNNINSIRFPRQGYTSTVGIIQSNRGTYVIKRTKGELFCSGLNKEIFVLNCLAKETKLPIPKVMQFVQQIDKKQCWAVFEFFEGETLRTALWNEKNNEKRWELIFKFGKILSQIHSTPCPTELIHEQHWLDQMLIQAEYNLKNQKVDGNEELLEKIKINKPNDCKQSLIHGDYTIDNVLVYNGEITCVIDWGTGAYGDPRYDVSLAIRPKPNAFENKLDKQIFFEGYRGNIDDKVYDYFVSGLYEFF
ncbi:phosphotransferase family protein [Neobacillus terrae]|uniref:phosphotransferase family protein n=1 Tax=Neobacillus terrae TaxID=3034837 RepID=UPI001409B39B|nr:aminoglycoside phosphotransferase family protein [Neobacillus terrae]NHM34086.1 aminoglycoside phosphotransferase family protein [Neobacillus terrae]